MRGSVARAIAVACVLAQTGCSGPHAYVREGDADSVQITYAGDPDAALPIARAYCLRFERSAVFVSADGEIAAYRCAAR